MSIVAVKTLKENATDKERADLVAELQIMKTLEPHPNVVKLLGCCTEKEPIFLIMEYVSKGKLQSYLRNSRAERYYNNMHGQSKSLTSRDLTSFVYQVAKGMEFLSAKGVRNLRNFQIALDRQKMYISFFSHFLPYYKYIVVTAFFLSNHSKLVMLYRWVSLHCWRQKDHKSIPVPLATECKTSYEIQG